MVDPLYAPWILTFLHSLKFPFEISDDYAMANNTENNERERTSSYGQESGNMGVFLNQATLVFLQTICALPYNLYNKPLYRATSQTFVKVTEPFKLITWQL